jgi:carboxylate-amine ligase
MRQHAAPTLGVEEEYLLLHPRGGHPVARFDAVSGWVGLWAGDDVVQHELLQAQTEVATPVCHDLSEVEQHLRSLRRLLSDAARSSGARLAAVGAAPVLREEVPVSDDDRYRDLDARAPALVAEQLICGMHVHVAVPDRGLRVEVVNRLRLDIPLLVAVGANSPFWNGRDSGFASWRSVHWDRWPTAGPPPHLAGEDELDERVETLLETGAIGDRRQVYWQIRVSERYPTVELRCFDVQLRVDDCLALAGLVRALVAGARADAATDGPYPVCPPDVLRAASWAAARHGLENSLFDLRSSRRRPAAELVTERLDRLGPVLAATGDGDVVQAGLERLLRQGTGAERQRSAVDTGGLSVLSQFLSEQTTA